MGTPRSGISWIGSRLIRILIAEDSAEEVELLQRELGRAKGAHFDFRSVERLSEAVAIIETRWPDVLLLDLSLPDSRGVQTVEKARAADPGLPIVILTGLPAAELADAATRFNVQDYLLKGETSPQVVLRALRYAIQSMNLTMAVRRQQDDLLALQGVLSVTAFRLTREGDVQSLGHDSEPMSELVSPDVLERLKTCFSGKMKEGRRATLRLPGGMAEVLRLGPDELFVVLKRPRVALDGK